MSPEALLQRPLAANDRPLATPGPSGTGTQNVAPATTPEEVDPAAPQKSIVARPAGRLRHPHERRWYQGGSR